MKTLIAMSVLLAGLCVFCGIGHGIFCILSQWYWRNINPDPYGLPFWIYDLPYVICVLLWGVIYSTIRLTLW